MPRASIRKTLEPPLPFKLYTAREAADVLEVTENWVTAARRAGAPFPGGRTRPEWVLTWLHDHPDFTLKEHQ
jgi:hypothetical protein